MVKMSILFKQPLLSAEEFEAGYNRCLALIEAMPGIRRRQACMIFGGPGGTSPFYRLLEIYFEDTAELDAALRSSQGQSAGAALMDFQGGRMAEIFFSEVYEDDRPA